MKIKRSLWWRQQVWLGLVVIGFGLLVGMGWELARQRMQQDSALTNADAPAVAQLAAGLRAAGR